MGFPHPTHDVPGDEPALAALVERVVVDPLGHRDLLLRALRGEPVALRDGRVEPGHVCVTCWVLDPSGEQTLLVAHQALGWVEPGGHLEHGEDPAEAASRELFEETGLELAPFLDAPALVHAGVFPARGEHPEHLHWDLGYLFVASPSAVLRPEAGAPAVWFPIDALPSPAVADLPLVLPALAPLVALAN
jgi:ADP-ribose pyrophosphatase YjhB (NUDIX family)